MGDYPHQNKAKFIDNENNEYSLDLNENNQIILPIALVRDKKHGKIKVKYICDEFEKEGYLRNPKREILEFDGFDIQTGIGKNKVFIVDLRETAEVYIKINYITFKDNSFEFYGRSNEIIDNVYIENLLSFDRVKYHVSIEDFKFYIGEYDIRFIIPYEDIFNQAVKKWELLTSNKFKSFELEKKFEFYNGHRKILFKNARNKILIEDDVFIPEDKLEEYYDEIIELKDKNKKLRNENKKLYKENKSLIKKNKELKLSKKEIEKENKKLKRRIEKYKSRVAVKTADKLKKMI